MREHSDDDVLNEILIEWHRRSVRTPPHNGFPKVNSACRLYRTSRQYDYDNGAMQQDADSARLELVDFAIYELPQPWRTAVMFNARNLYSVSMGGHAVWTSPRLPTNDIARAHLVMHARAKLLLLLERDGVA